MSLDLSNEVTVGQLKEMLNRYDDNLPVVVGRCSGDYWRTEIAPPFISTEVGVVEYSSYHNCPKVCYEDRDKECPVDVPQNNDQIQVLIIR